MVRTARFLITLSLAAALSAGPPGLTVDYPADRSLFPSDIAPPTLLWHDSTSARSWAIDITFASGDAPIHVRSNGPQPAPGEIDPDCVSTTNELPKVDRSQHSWMPEPATWVLIKRKSTKAPATVTIKGLAAGRIVSTAFIHIRASTDPVGAPIFYRDVPLMPVETSTGTIQPLSPYAVRLVKWRLRDVSQSKSRVVMESLPVCANCHSFSADGRSMGMDLDGLQRNKGRYFLSKVQGDVNVASADVIQWASERGRLDSPIRVGFMSQLSPKGDTVVTTVDTPGSTTSNYYVANFTDYRFLQVFFPTRGRLAWYRGDTGILQSLPGADDPAYVHFGAVWSPDGQSLVFARAPVQDPNPPGQPVARFANDPHELQIQYDLYRIPFNNGQGGRAEPIAGASANGMSNTFPKISPDGRWLVYVQARNGQLLRPDSQLYIVPAKGGMPRRMLCNTARMNSWHSFSPNSRWMVFSSKARSPYTQMYLTHIDDEGNDTPPILIGNATAANRAVNLPEFVNVAPEGLRSIGGPALDYYRLYDRALYLQKAKRYDESAAKWKAVLDIAPEDSDVRRHLGVTLLLAGRRAEALPYLARRQGPDPRESPLARAIRLLESGEEAARVAVSSRPTAEEHYYLALVSLRGKDNGAALIHLREALRLNPDYAEAHQRLAETSDQPAEALPHWLETVRLRPNNAAALRRAAWILATNEKLHNGQEAVALAVRALLLMTTEDSATLDTLAAAYADAHRFDEAISTARRAMQADPASSPIIQRRIDLYQAGRPWRAEQAQWPHPARE
ncbi:tetratricopeptide repeat protein [uncultured Paludibaculum sp.]|uniref:tetratricopeptide repeat protein n=1 Tax=uncultured Paludibaculum sp. TaxID=1765020 RepID=UPI002AABD3B1|nr:hypothetical protein [uncultured Paludibaculum sp.]